MKPDNENAGFGKKPKTPRVEANGKGFTGTQVKSDVIALKAITALRKRDLEGIDAYIGLLKTMEEPERTAFGEALATSRFLDTSHDPEGLAELSVATLEPMQKEDCGCSDHDA